MRRNNLKLLEKNCAKKMSRFNVCNLIELLTQLALVWPWQAHTVETTLFWQLCKALRRSLLNTMWLRSFSRILRCSHHRLANQSSSSSYHHNGQMCFVLLWNKREHIICPSLNILNSWGFKLKVFYFKFLAWNNCHKISSHDVHPVGVYFISE